MRRRAAALLAALLLSACATPPPGPGEAAWTSGRLAVTIAASGTKEASSMNAAFELRGRDHSGELRLSTTLGMRIAQARWSPGVAVLDTPDGERRFATLDELSSVALGEALPLAAWPDWLAGRPWPEAPHDPFDGGFRQMGWTVDTARIGQGWIEARRESAPSVSVRVRLDDPAAP